MKEETTKRVKKTESIKVSVGGQTVNLACGFIGGVEANKDKDEVGVYLGDPSDEFGLFYSLHSVIRSAIKAKKAIGEDDEDIRAFLAVVIERAIEKELKGNTAELN